jgi:hypothetical protein
MIVGIRTAAMIPAVAYARLGVKAEMAIAMEPSNPATRTACTTSGRSFGTSDPSPEMGSGATSTRPRNSTR